MVQGLSDKQWRYFGSPRGYYSGLSLGSTAAWSWFGWSGTNTGFGSHGDEECQRVMIASSGNSYAQWSWNSGVSIGGELYSAEAYSFDGMFKSGIWMRSNAVSKVKVWAW